MAWLDSIGGTFPIHTAVSEAEPWGISAWTKTARIDVILLDGSADKFFLKCETGDGAESSMYGEYHSSEAINSILSGFCPKPVAKGKYIDDAGLSVFFYVQQFHDFELKTEPDPELFAIKLAQLYLNGKSPNGMFGFHVPAGGGVLHYENKWTKTWTEQYTTMFKEVLATDIAANGPWPEYEKTAQHVIDRVIPRLIGIMETDGRHIEPTLVHPDLWEGNIGIDRETGEIMAFDPASGYYHNEFQFGTWRCSWASYFGSPTYQRFYKLQVPPSDPINEWDDRNRMYAVNCFMCDSAGHPGSKSRRRAYNDMLYLSEKYAPLDSLEKYDPEWDLKVTGILEEYDVMHGAQN